MRDLMIWKFVGCVSAINGLVCFGVSSTYKKSFGKLGFGGLLVYLLAGLVMSFLILRAKRIQVSGKLQGLVAALIFDVICLISVLVDKLVDGKSDALSIISYGSFALMSLSMSRKFELGFEAGFSTFFLSLFAAQLYKINWILLPIALVFCSVLIILRHRSESGVQPGSITPNGYHPVEFAVMEIGDGEDDMNEERQESLVSGQSLSSWNNEQNNQGESSQATHHSPSFGELLEGSILLLSMYYGDNEQNNEQEGDPSSLPALRNQSTIYSSAECFSIFLIFLVICYPYIMANIPFERWDLVYIYIAIAFCICTYHVTLWAKSFRIPKKFHGLLAVLFFVVFCLISDKLVTGKADAFCIISYGSFALMSPSMSRKSELGFEKGFSTWLLSLSLFVEQVSKIKWILLPSAAVSGQSLLPSQTMHHSPSNGQVSEGSMLDWDNLQNNEQEEDESWDQDHVSSRNSRVRIQNGRMHSSGEPELMSAATARELLRSNVEKKEDEVIGMRMVLCRRRMGPGIQTISSTKDQ